MRGQTMWSFRSIVGTLLGRRFQAASFTGPALCRFEAHKVVGLLKKRKVSPAEVLSAALTRIAQVEPLVNAMPTLCVERARASIAQLDRLRQINGGEPGWLAGLPIGIKDLTPVAGVRTTMGSVGLKDFVPTESDPLVELLEARGAIIVGKTNTPEMGAGGNTFNDVFGKTRNPWDTGKNAGGSSGGAAVSLATGEVWLSHGFRLGWLPADTSGLLWSSGSAAISRPVRWGTASDCIQYGGGARTDGALGDGRGFVPGCDGRL